MSPAELARALSDAVSDGTPVALVTVTGFSGSVPRELGAKMLVYADGRIQGTIGGGRLEAQAAQDAVAALAQGTSRAASYELEPKMLGMYCGGRAEVFIDCYVQALRLVILGGGHVGEKLAGLAAFMGLPHFVCDDRPEFCASERFPAARERLVCQPDEALKRLNVDEKTAVAIVTRCHGFDLRCLVAALGTPAFYVGMIGSRTKTRRLFDLCRRRGLEPGQDRVRAPIGLDLGGDRPEDIALAVVAEIMQLRHGKTARPLSRLERIPS